MSDCLFSADRRLSQRFKRTEAVSTPARCCLRHEPISGVAGGSAFSGAAQATFNKIRHHLVEPISTNLPKSFSGAQLFFGALPGDFPGLTFVPAPLMRQLHQGLRWGWWALVKLPGFTVDLVNQLRCPHHRCQRQLGLDVVGF